MKTITLKAILFAGVTLLLASCAGQDIPPEPKNNQPVRIYVKAQFVFESGEKRDSEVMILNNSQP